LRRSAWSTAKAVSMARMRSAGSKGLERNSEAPAFMALTVEGMSPWPVRKMMGGWAEPESWR